MRVQMILLVLILAVGITVGASPQEAAKASDEKTRLESFAGVRGEVVVRGFSKIGSIKGRYEGEVAVEAKEFTTASTGKHELGVTVEASSGERYASTQVAYVDLDEIDGVISGLDYIAKLDKSVTKLGDFQADFHTKGGLTLSTASSGTSIIFAVSCSTLGGKLLLFDADAIPKFRELLVKAKTRLESLSK